jgi:hypothetical protein
MTIRHRESLVYMLCEAAELEHALMCGYLYAAFSLKGKTDEGLTAEQTAMAGRWRRSIVRVAIQEMQHLALVNNLLVALGEAPHFSRPNLPVPGRHFPDTVRLGLLPFGQEALRHFLYLERPEGMERKDAGTDDVLAYALPVMIEDDIVPFGQEFDTVGGLYRQIGQALTDLVDAFGEEWVFLGAPSQQSAAVAFGWTELRAVTDLASARAALGTIIEQGEGASGDWRAGHFGQFLQVLREYTAACADNPRFDPVRPVVPVRTRIPVDLSPRRHGAVVTDHPVTGRVVDAFNVANETLLQVLSRIYGHSTESDAQLGVLGDVAVGLMRDVLGSLGGLLGRLPAGSQAPGATAGPTFDLFYCDGYLLPQQAAFWTILHERLEQLANHLAVTGQSAGAPGELLQVQARVRSLAGLLAAGRPDLAARFRPAAV